MFRNREFRQFAVLFSIIAVINVILGFSINKIAGIFGVSSSMADGRFGFSINIIAGVIAITSAAAYGALFWRFTKARYKSIGQISEQIDLVLHNADRLYIAEADEGELSILQSEITKMTLRIREQNEALKKEKGHLADSMADIAHQLRTPLTSVNLILSLIENNEDENERRALIREIKELFVQMDWLLDSLLKLSRLDAGIVEFKDEQIYVDSLINSACRPLLIQMELHNIVLQKDVPENIVIQGDFGWLSEAVQNIIKNCMESAGDNGMIEIDCTNNTLFTEITIHDSGKGLQKKIYLVFSTDFIVGKIRVLQDMELDLLFAR